MRVLALFRDGVGWGKTRRLQPPERHLCRGRALPWRPTLVKVHARLKARIILAVRATAPQLAATVRRNVRPDLIKIAAAAMLCFF